MVSYRILYGRRCRYPRYSDELVPQAKNDSENDLECTIIQTKDEASLRLKKELCQSKTLILIISIGDRVFIRLAPFKHMKRFMRKGKLAPKYINPHEIVGKVAYKLALLTSMEHIHQVFHVLSLHKYISDPSHVC